MQILARKQRNQLSRHQFITYKLQGLFINYPTCAAPRNLDGMLNIFANKPCIFINYTFLLCAFEIECSFLGLSCWLNKD